MTELTSGLNTITPGVTGWMVPLNADITLLDSKLVNVMTGSNIPGSTTVSDVAAETAEALTDSSGGTASNTIAAVSGTPDDTNINNNFASLTDEITKLRADNAELRTKVNALLAALRKTSGCGVLSG